MNSTSIKIDDTLVRRLIATQFPQWQDLTIQPVVPQGWDNRSFRLDEQMLVRMPSAADYATQVEKEHRWLPKLAPLLPLAIPKPLVIGEPAYGYPWKWSIYRWLEGEPATTAPITNLCDFARSLAQFLSALQSIDSTDGPLPSADNFYRGGSLRNYDAETKQAIASLKNKIAIKIATEVWETALSTTCHFPPVWVHGDISAGNLLVQNGQLCAVVDFGQLAVGDPACDLAITWTLLESESREVFRNSLKLDADTWARGRAWTLWKFLIVAAGMTDWNAIEASQPLHIINEVLAEHIQGN